MPERRVPDLGELIEDPNEAEAESFSMPSFYMTPSRQMYEMVELLTKEHDEKTRLVPDMLIVYGVKGAGKSCFVKKVGACVFEHTLKNFQATFREWIYLDLQVFHSLLHFLMGASIRRNKKRIRTLKEVVEYARQYKCYFVLDHCNFLALSYGKQFYQTVVECIKDKLEKDSKLILIFETDSRLEGDWRRYDTYKFELDLEQRSKIFSEVRRIPKYSKPGSFGKDQRDAVSAVYKRLEKWLPQNILTYTKLCQSNPTVVDEPAKFLLVIDEEEAALEKQKKTLEEDRRRIASQVKSLSNNQQLGLRMLCFLSRSLAIQILSLLLSQANIQMSDLMNFLTGNSNKKVTALVREVVFQMSSDVELKIALSRLLWVQGCVISFFMERPDSNNHEPFEMSPLVELPENSRDDAENVRRIHAKLSQLIPGCNKAISSFVDDMLNPVSQIRQPQRLMDRQIQPNFCKVITYAPLLKHYLEDSPSAALRSKDVHKSIHALRFVKPYLELYTQSYLELAVLLMFARSQENGEQRTELEVVKSLFEKNSTEVDQRVRMVNKYLCNFLDLQTEYLSETKLKLEPNRQYYISVLRRTHASFKSLINVPSAKKRERHITNYANACVHLLRNSEGVTLRREEVSELIKELKRFQEVSIECRLKLFECRFIELSSYRQSTNHLDYCQLLTDLEEGFRNNPYSDKVTELSFSIKQKVLKLQKCFIRVMSARPFLSSSRPEFDKLPRTIDPWLCNCVLELSSERVTGYRNHSQAVIESDILTYSKLSEVLKNECRALFLRVDVEEKTNDGLVINLEDEQRSCWRKRIGVEELQALDFSRVGILVLCGKDVSRIRQYVKPANLILVELKQREEEKIYDFYRRNSVWERYCQTFLVQFVRALLDMQGSKLEQKRIEDSFLLAHHAGSCAVSGLLKRKYGIEDFIETNRYICKSRELVTDMKPGEISCRDVPTKVCAPFWIVGYRSELEKILSVLLKIQFPKLRRALTKAQPSLKKAESLKSDEQGVLILLEGSSPLASDLCKEIFYILRRVQLRNSIYSENPIDFGRQQTWHYYILDIKDTKIDKEFSERLNAAVNFGHRIVLRVDKFDPASYRATKTIISTNKTRSDDELQFAVRMCRELEEEYREGDKSEFNANTFDRIVEECLKSSHDRKEKIFSKQIQKKWLFSPIKRLDPNLQLSHRSRSELPDYSPGLISHQSENPNNLASSRKPTFLDQKKRYTKKNSSGKSGSSKKQEEKQGKERSKKGESSSPVKEQDESGSSSSSEKERK